MRSKLAYFILFPVLIMAPQAWSQSGDSNFTLQVGSFPDSASAERFVSWLKYQGEQPAWGVVELPGRGNWTRVFIGAFQTMESARQYGSGLIKRGVIPEFLVKTPREIEGLSRPRKTSNELATSRNYPAAEVVAKEAPTNRKSSEYSTQSQTSAHSVKTARERAMMMSGFMTSAPVISLPVVEHFALNYAPAFSRSFTLRTDPVLLAINLIIGEMRTGSDINSGTGGLWITGDLDEAMARIRWIVGENTSILLRLGKNGKVEIDMGKLAEEAGINGDGAVDDPLKVVNYIYSNEGLLLLVQLTHGPYRYCLHLSHQAPTLGESIEVGGSVNLDNNYDSRINPYRRNGKKLESERPPVGFDSMVAINPVARWFNLREQNIVPVGNITFHELAEAHAKLVLELDYLGQGAYPGAHNIALERERKLKAQRPFSDMVVTSGSNRVLRNEEEIRQFYSQSGINVSSPR